MGFYTNGTIINDFKTYIKHLITHINPYTGLSYAEDPTIFAYETGNELGGPIFGDKWVPNSWTSEISSFIKSLAPHKLIVDGTYGINSTHLMIPTVDIYSDHFYPPNVTKLDQGVALVKNANKVYLAGEYDWTGNQAANKISGTSSLPQFYNAIEQQASQTPPVIAADLFWSLFMHDVPNCQVSTLLSFSPNLQPPCHSTYKPCKTIRKTFPPSQPTEQVMSRSSPHPHQLQLAFFKRLHFPPSPYEATQRPTLPTNQGLPVSHRSTDLCQSLRRLQPAVQRPPQHATQQQSDQPGPRTPLAHEPQSHRLGVSAGRSVPRPG